MMVKKVISHQSQVISFLWYRKVYSRYTTCEILHFVQDRPSSPALRFAQCPSKCPERSEGSETKDENRIRLLPKAIFLILFLLTTYNLQLATCYAQPRSSTELINNAKEYDGKIVTYQGEVIGDIMVRGEFAWINVRDETGAIGVFCPKDLVSVITCQGSYGYQGDVISVRGVFHRFCPQHGSDTDIHAEKITVVQKGERLQHLLPPQKVKASIVMSIIAFSLMIIHLMIRRLRENKLKQLS